MMEDNHSNWGIWCVVYGGITGFRESWLKHDGVLATFETEQDAQVEADRITRNLGPHRTASFEYTPRRF